MCKLLYHPCCFQIHLLPPRQLLALCPLRRPLPIPRIIFTVTAITSVFPRLAAGWSHRACVIPEFLLPAPWIPSACSTFSVALRAVGCSAAIAKQDLGQLGSYGLREVACGKAKVVDPAPSLKHPLIMVTSLQAHLGFLKL